MHGACFEAVSIGRERYFKDGKGQMRTEVDASEDLASVEIEWRLRKGCESLL